MAVLQVHVQGTQKGSPLVRCMEDQLTLNMNCPGVSGIDGALSMCYYLCHHFLKFK